MSQNTIEERVARLEQLVNRLLIAKVPESQPRQGDWRRTFGMFAGDPIMKEIIDAGNRIREEERRNVAIGDGLLPTNDVRDGVVPIFCP